MEPDILHIHGEVGSGESRFLLDTEVLYRLIDHAMDARKRVFVSFNFDALVDGKQRLRSILEHLDQDANPTEWDPIVLLGNPGQCVFSSLREADAPGGSVALSRAQFRSILRSALREIDRAMHIVLSLFEKVAHPVAEFLLERRWFFLHTSHPPRPFGRHFRSVDGGCAPDWLLSINCSV